MQNSLNRVFKAMEMESLRGESRASVSTRDESAQASEFLRHLAAFGPAVIYRLSADLRVSYISPNVGRILGSSPEEICADPDFFFGRIHTDDRSAVQRQLSRALNERSPQLEIEYRFARRNGGFRSLYNLMRIDYDDHGRPADALGYMMDVTDHRQVEEQLRATLEKMEKSRDDMLSILNQLSLGTAITDENGCVTFLSDAARQVLETDAGEFLGKHWSAVFGLGSESKARLEAMSVYPDLRSRVPVHLETRGGRHRWMEIDVRDDPRNPQRKVFFLYDTTEIHDLRRLLDERAQFQDLVGKSKSMRLVYDQIREVARVDSTVLIEGETGAGKELVARAIHSCSHRNRKPFIAVNCAAINDSLVASQLFGHKRGSFTGAIEDQQGVFEAANAGTLFLDEIGDIPTTVQTNLLRVLEDHEITRLGESRPRKVDVRIIAATSRQLSDLVAKGSFRPDLLYRIRVARILLPALQDRREDIPLLVARFLSDSVAATGKAVREVTNDAMRILMEYSWPGNVRELKNSIEYAVIRCKGDLVQMNDLPPEIAGVGPGSSVRAAVGGDERERLLEALKQTNGNRALAARRLGIGRATLYRRMARHRIPGEESS